ncbi:MAG: DUF1080 domain-containing protein [Phycisphaerales bacterium]|nr:DUF1080 domain-containing protein [Phycisphaerales bacterium]
MIAPLADGQTSGAIMRVWQVDRHLEALAPLVPGELPNIWLHVDVIDLDDDRGDFGAVEDDFLALLDTELLTKTEGTYTFRLTSDDGSQLWIGGRPIVDNDGLHGAESKTGAIHLDEGSRPIQIKFFERGSDAMLRLEWKTPESRDFELIPREAMRFKMPVERRIQDGVKEVAPRLKEKVDVGPSPQGPHNVLTAEQASKGWQLLFDGTQASPWWRGFKKRGLPAGWVVENGMLVRAQGGGDIITRSQFDDFDFYVDWMVAPGGNSGIFFNGLEDGNAIYETAPEMQILDNLRHSDGATALQSAGSNYALHAPQVDSSRVAGEWNRVRIRVEGDHVQQWLNGVKMADYVIGSEDWKRRVAGSKFAGMPRYGTAPMGHIGLQDHGDRVSFRNIRIRPLAPSTDP